MRIRALAVAGIAAAMTLSTLAMGTTPAEGDVVASAARAGDTVTFQGFANVADPGQSHIPGEFFLTAFADQSAADALGTDLQDAYIEELEDGSGLRFTWQMGSSLPGDGLPEVVRYNWAFESEGQSYQLQVKRSNLASVTTPEAPVDHALEAAEGDWWFQLRGACTTNYLVEQNPVAGCYHLGFFEGDVDIEAGTVSMELPYGAKDGIGRIVADTFERGTPITAAESAGMSITASAQAVISNATTSQFLNGWGTYYPGTVVQVALGTANGPSTGYALLDTDGDGSFAGSLQGAGSHLWVKACRGYGIEGFGPQPCFESAQPIG